MTYSFAALRPCQFVLERLPLDLQPPLLLETSTISTTGRAIRQVLHYFELFSYPLDAEEIWQYLPVAGTPFEAMVQELERMATQGEIVENKGFYQLYRKPEWVPRRLVLNKRAETMMPTARRMARFIGAFPYVRAVFVSGSMSKNCMAPDGDIDFFIVTAPGRMWFSRTLMVLFKKLFLLNSHKYFCINYFVDTDHLEIHEKNLYTATEIVTLLPMYGQEFCEKFVQANTWARDYLPQFPIRKLLDVPAGKAGFWKKTAEKIFSGSLGEWLDVNAMETTLNYWRRKFKHFNKQKFDSAFSAGRGHSKHHPLHFQGKIMESYQKILQKEGLTESLAK